MAEPAAETSRPSRRRWWWLLAGIAVVVAVAFGGFVAWALDTPEPGPDAVGALASDDLVDVVEDDGYRFVPTGGATVGFIFYPGGRVDPASYAASVRPIAEAGYLVVVPEVRLNLAVLDANRADAIIAAHPSIERWAIGGHSLGGAMAARYGDRNPETIEGLALWAAFPAESSDLSTAELSVVSVFATRDGLTTVDDIDRSRELLPPDTTFVAIDGGNHAQFGDYGEQSGDNPATITPAEQQRQAVAATLTMLEQLRG